MKVLMVGKGPPERGGIAAFLGDMVEGPLAAMVDVELCNLTRAGDIPQGGALSPANIRRTARDVREVHRRARGCDVVHLHSALAPAVTMVRASLLVLAARLAGASVVVHAHGGLAVDWLRGRGARLVTRLALRPAAMVIAVAASVEDAFAPVLGEHRTTHIPNGVDLQRFHPSPPDQAGHDRQSAPVLLYVGLLSPRKGVLDLLDASEALHERGVAHELVLVGGTPDEGAAAAVEVTRRAAAVGARLDGTVPHEQMADVYRTADVFCLPSWWEAMPLTVLEAMATGVPVVATDVGAVGAVLRTVDDGGVTVPARQPHRLADALQPLLQDASLREQVGSSARRRAEIFGNDITARRIAELYGEVTT